MFRLKAFLTYFFLFLILGLVARTVLAVDPGQVSGGSVAQVKPDHSKPAEQVYKNIQVLKGVPSDEIIPAMQFVAASLGVECGFCHVEHHFDQDDKKPKKIARKMMQMEMDINKSDFESRLKVTCNSCHRGTRTPLAVPLIKDTDLDKVPALLEQSDSTNLPNPEQLIEKYVEAVGGASAIGKLETLYEKGTADFNGHTFAAEVYAKSPAHRIFVMHMPEGDTITGFDGSRGWSSAPHRPTRDMPASEIGGAKMDADLQIPLHIKELFGELHSAPSEMINGRQSNQLVATDGGVLRARLYFDEHSGLLVRVIRYAKSPLGLNPTRVDYADYRPVADLQFPFRWEVARPQGRFAVQVQSAQPDIPIEDSIFAAPADALAGAPPTVH